MKRKNHKLQKVHRRPARRETQVCPHCFTPVDPLEHFCPNCGQTTGQLTPYIPYLNIRHNYGSSALKWRNIWNKKNSWPVRILGAIVFLVVCGPLFVLAMPFVIAEKIRTRRCGYRNAAEDSRNKNT